MADAKDEYRLKQIELAGQAREMAEDALTKPAIAAALILLAEALQNDD